MAFGRGWLSASTPVDSKPTQERKFFMCPDKKRLTEELLKSTRELVEIHERDIAELISGENLPTSDSAVEWARQKRDQARRALMRHVTEHCCGGPQA